MATHPKVSLPLLLSSIATPWTPKLIATLNSTHDVKIAKISGSFIWHSHPNSDELFYVISGSMVLEIEDPNLKVKGQDIHMQKGDMFVVPQGVRHRPVSEDGAEIMMMEAVGTVNTGDEEGKYPELTVVPEDVRAV